MARNKNNTRKRNKKTYRKKNRKTYRKMRGGGMSSLFSGLTYNLKNSFSMFGTKATEQAKTTINEKKAEAQAKADARTSALAKLADLGLTQDEINAL